MISEEDEHLLRFLDAVSCQLACLLDLDGPAKAGARCAPNHTKREHVPNNSPQASKRQRLAAAKKRGSQLAKVISPSSGDKLSRSAKQSALRASKSNRQQPSRATKQRRTSKQGARSAVAGNHPDLGSKVSAAGDAACGQTLLQCPHEDGLIKPLADQQQQQHHHHHHHHSHSHNQLRLADSQTDQFGDSHKLFGSLQPQHNPLEAHPIAATTLDGHLTLSICDELTLGGGSLSPSATHLSPIDPAISSHFESAHGYYRPGNPDDSSAMHAHHQSQQLQQQSLGSYHGEFGPPPAPPPQATPNGSANNGANHAATGAGNAHPSMSASSQQHEAPTAVQIHLGGQQHLQHNAMAIILSGQPDESALNPSSLVECYPNQIHQQQQQQQQQQHLHHQQQQQQHHNHQQQHQSDLQHGRQHHHSNALVEHASHNHHQHQHQSHHPTYHPLEQTEANQWLPCLANGDQHNLVSNGGSNCRLDQVLSPTTNGANGQLGAGDQVQSAFGVPVYHHSYYSSSSDQQQQQQQHNHQHQHHQHHLNQNHHHHHQQQQSEHLDSFHRLNDDYSGAPLAGGEHLVMHHSQHRRGQQNLGQSDANSPLESGQSQANGGANNSNGASNNSNSNASFEHHHIQQQQQQHLQLHNSPAYLDSAGQHHLGQQQHNGQQHHHYHLALGDHDHHHHHHHQLHHNQHHGIPLVGGIESSSIILQDINLASATWSSPEDLYSI